MKKIAADKVLLIDDDENETTEDQEKDFMLRVFDYIDSITTTKKYLMVDEKEEKFFRSAWVIIHKAISYFPDCLLLVNEANKLYTYSPKMQYDFLMQVIPARKRTRVKWPKNKQPYEIVRMIQEKYSCKRQCAEDIINALTKKQLEQIIEKINNKGGVINE